ncbi:MAG TPA: SH3 domain-containing protein [Anaerolineales bacterium]|nr:SH3 domain-containing protein [Anaerolineales bacterium]
MTATGLGVGILLGPEQARVRAQEASTPTGISATVTYTDPINVRSGPSTVYYPIIGQLAPGDVVPALGVSPAREWVQIVYPPTGATGWVYASFVSVSGGELRIIEPPPTPTPPVTATIDPTLAAAFNTQPTETRLPTFTPPPPLDIPEFNDASRPRAAGAVFGFFIVGLGLSGAVGLLVSYVLRR